MGFLSGVRTWAPFNIDALGIVTLLGASNVQKAVGRLVFSPYAEYLPQLGAYVFADNSFAETVGGFVLYNITDGLMATDLSAWFTRWLLCQEIAWQETTLHIKADRTKRRDPVRLYVSGLFAVILNCFLLAFPVGIGDWYGFASATGLVLTILGRSTILSAVRTSLDLHVSSAEKTRDAVKLFITMPNGRVVSVRTTRGIATECLLTEARPRNRQLYRAARATIWVAFATHAVTLGMASLCTQMIIVAATLLPTLLIVLQTGCIESRIGHVLQITKHDDQSVTNRSRAYLKLELSPEEEASMISWHLFPQQSNKFWWNRYKTLQGKTLEKTQADTKAAGAQVIPVVGHR